MGVGTGGKLGVYRLFDGGLSRSGVTSFLGAGIPLFTTALSLAVFVCSAFAAVAGCVVMALYLRGDFFEAPGFSARLAAKTILLTLLALAAGWALRRAAPLCVKDGLTEHDEPRATSWTFAVLIIAFALSMLLVLPNLSAYPWPAPDETHHLIVARNLAEYGAYASGHPDDAFTYFDPYDSVGAPVILPVAAVFSLSGTGLAGARIVIALSYLILCVLVFLVMRRPFGPTAAACATLMMTMAFGSVYLARSLYGEVPALMYLLAGLWCWGRALDSEKGAALPLVAGVCFGLAVLSKTFLMIGVWAFIGVWIYDRLTYRRIATRHVALPAVGLLAILAAWAAVEFSFRHLMSGEEVSTLVYYRHSLMFGLDTLPRLWPLFSAQALSVLIALLAFAFVAPRVFRDRYDPPAMVLFLLAILFAFWWIFFTPARIPRYMWYSCAIAGMFSGVFLCFLIGRVFERKWQKGWAAAALGMASLIIGTGLLRVAPQLQLALFEDRVQPERSLARYIQALPPESRVATTYWPAQRSLNFLANRHIEVLDAAAAYGDYETIVFSQRFPPVPPDAIERGVKLGHYVVLSTRIEGETRSNDH